MTMTMTSSSSKSRSPPSPLPGPKTTKTKSRKRRAASTSSSASSSSKIVEVTTQDHDYDGSTSKQSTIRIGRLVSLQGISAIQSDGSRPIDKTFFYNSVAAFLASKHFNERRGDVVPWLPDALQECNFYFQYEFRDTQWSGLEAAKQLADATGAYTGNRDTTSEDGDGDTTNGGTSGVNTSQQDTMDFTNTTTNTTTNLNATDTVDPPDHHEGTLSPRNTTTTTTTTAAGGGGGRKRSRNLITPSLQRLAQQQKQSTLLEELELEPFAIFGAYWSSSTKPLSILSGGLGLPHISGASTSAELETTSPMFARTVTSNDGDARAAILYYKDIGVTHLAVIYIKDSWGINYHASLFKYASAHGIQVKSFPYDKTCPQTPEAAVCDVERAVSNLAQSQYRHVFAIMHNWKQVIGLAYDYGIVGNSHYSWIGAEEKKWTGDAFQLTRDNNNNDDGEESDTESYKLAQALHGIGTLNIYFELVPAFEEALEEIAFNPELQQEYISTLHDPTVVQDYDFPRYDPTGFTNSIFDGVLSLGLAACNVSDTTNPFFTGEDLYRTLVEDTQFEGVSGPVAFDPLTGNRRQGMRYSIEYVVLSDERTTPDAYRFESKLATVVAADDTIRRFNPFVYFDNTTDVPPSLPTLDAYNYNLISRSEQVVGYAMASVVMFASFVSLLWVVKNRNIFVVRASQPIFLCQLCLGTFIMALAVFPASLPGASTSLATGDPRMTMACMSQLWLVFLGFVTAFSAVFAKTYRLNKIMGGGINMRRIRVEAHDVMAPFFILMFINVFMLLCITFLSPYQYERVDLESYDIFGRSTESFGSCRPENNLFYLFLVVMSLSNAVGVLVALYQAWKARHLPMEFSESYYLALSLASFTETMCLGGPILIVSYNSPSAWYLLSSTILCIGCMTILVPLLLPKFLGRKQQQRGIAVTRSPGQGGGKSIATLSRFGTGAGSGSIYVSGLAGSSSTIEHTTSTQNLGRGRLAIHHRGGSSNLNNDSFHSRTGGSQSSIRSWAGAGSFTLNHHHPTRPSNSNPNSRRNSKRLSTVNSLGMAMDDDEEEDDDDENNDQTEAGRRASRRRSSRKASQKFWSSMLSRSGNVSADRTPPKRNSGHAAVVAGDQQHAHLTIQESIKRLQELSGIEFSDSTSSEDEEEADKKEEVEEEVTTNDPCSVVEKDLPSEGCRMQNSIDTPDNQEKQEEEEEKQALEEQEVPEDSSRTAAVPFNDEPSSSEAHDKL